MMNVLKRIFQNQLSLIYKVQIEDKESSIAYQKTEKDLDEIADFYKKALRPDLAASQLIKEFFQRGYTFWAIEKEGIIVAGAWTFLGIVKLQNPSFIVLSYHKKNAIKMHSDSLYMGYVFTLDEHRGNHYCEAILNTVFSTYVKEGYKNCVLTTGPENIGMLSVIRKYKNDLIGVYRLTKIVRLYIRKEIFSFPALFCWSIEKNVYERK